MCSIWRRCCTSSNVLKVVHGVSFFKVYFIDYAISFPNFPLFILPLPCTPQPSSIPPPLVHIHTSSLTSLFPIPFSTSPHLFFAYQLCFLFPTNYASYSLYLSPTILPLPLLTEKPPCDVHFSDSVPVLVVCLVFVFVFFRFSC